jgi:two-component system, NarL family, response regulator
MGDAKLKIMLVDDHYLVRMGLSSVIALERDMAICAEASTGNEAINLYRAHRPDVTLMDLRMPSMNGLDATLTIRMEFPEARIIILSTYVSDEEIYAALQAGAMAYLVKSVARDELIQAIRKAAAGRRHVPPEVADRLAERMSRATLSSRELDVLRLLVKGRRNREIATALDITEGTVKLHVSSILGKLEVTDRTEAATVALKRGLVGLDA